MILLLFDAVSYTHLDVYKRQIYMFPVCILIGLLIRFALWLIRVMLRLALWLVKKTFVLIWKLVTLAFVLVISGSLFRQHSDG